MIRPAVCWGWLSPENWPTLKPGCAIRSIPDHGVCDGKRKAYTLRHDWGLGDERPTLVAQACLCNEVRSAIGRVLSSTPMPDRGSIPKLKDAAKLVAGRLRKLNGCDDFARWERRQVYEKYSGSRYRMYEEAEKDLLRGNLVTRKDSKVSMFIKAEKFWGSAKDPRAIQYRSPRYNIELGTFLKPIEKMAYRLCDSVRYNGVSGKLPWIVKGLNSVQRASVLRDKMACFDNPVVLSLDASRFDKHVSEEVLRVEHSVYLKLFRNNPELARLLDMQVENHVTSMHGFKYKVRGGRMSGDVNTALGNCMLSIIMVIAAIADIERRNGRKLARWSICDDGDDCLLILEKSDLSVVEDCILGQCSHKEHHPHCSNNGAVGTPWCTVADLGKADSHMCAAVRGEVEVTTTTAPGVFGQYGFVMKLENKAFELYQVVHCQTRPTYSSNRPSNWDQTGDATAGSVPGGVSDEGPLYHLRMVRDYRKVLKTALTAVRHYDSSKGARRVLRAIGLCEAFLGRGVPVLQKFGESLIRISLDGGEPTLPRFFDRQQLVPILKELGYDVFDPEMVRDGKVVKALLSRQTRYIDDFTRKMFAMTWGVSVDTQLQLEAQFDALQFDDLWTDCPLWLENELLPSAYSSETVEAGIPRKMQGQADYPDLDFV